MPDTAEPGDNPNAMGAIAQAWLDGGNVKIRTAEVGGAHGGAELAGRLLAAEEVSSVVLDRRRGEATVHLRGDCRSAANREEVLDAIASLAADQQAALKQTSRRIQAAGEILCCLDSQNGVDSYFRVPKAATGWKRIALLIGAAATFALAAIGVVLPGVPTTPFLLLTSYCLLRSSRRLHEKLLRSRVFGRFLRDWHTHHGVRQGVKTKSLVVLGAAVAATIAFSGLPIAVLIAVVLMAIVGARCVLSLPVIEPEAERPAT